MAEKDKLLALNYKATAFDLKLALLQYFRFQRQWVCVDEFRGADVIADTGKEVIEAEVKITKSDLINGERRKNRKHHIYKLGDQYTYAKRKLRPNKFLFCVPERLVDIALGWSNEINEHYGVVGFDTDTFENDVNLYSGVCHGNYIRIVKSAKSLHANYNNKLRWDIAKRTSAKITAIMKDNFISLIAKELEKEEC